MQFTNTLLLAASATLALAENVYIRVSSEYDEINGNTVGFAHEGAGLNYAFLGTAAKSQVLDYDSEAKKLYSHDAGLPTAQSFEVSGGYVRISVEDPTSSITFDSANHLLVNGSDSGFYACKNTNDPYELSANQYELMYYPSDIPKPSTCLDLTIVKDAVPSASPVFSVA